MKNAVRVMIEKFENAKPSDPMKKAWFRRLRELVSSDADKRPASNMTWVADIEEARKIVTDPENLKLYG